MDKNLPGPMTPFDDLITSPELQIMNRYSHRIPNFFTDHYDHPICEGGVLLRDMVYLQKPVSPR